MHSSIRIALTRAVPKSSGHPPNSAHFTSDNRLFSSSARSLTRNRIYDPIRTPPTFHDYLRTCSASNTLLLALFTSSACTPCRVITPLLSDIVTCRPASPMDKFGSLAFTEVELDSPNTGNGSMLDLGIEYGITSMPTLVGFGGRRSERMTERLVDTKMMADKARMEKWIDDQMMKGDPYATGGSSSGGILSRLFG